MSETAESFADLFEASLQEIEMQPGTIVTGTVVDLDNEYVTVNAGLKSEGIIPKSQFVDEQGEFHLQIGDEVRVALEAVEDGWGETRLSREKAKRLETWAELETAFSDEAAVEGIISGRVKGGYTVDVQGVRAFLPGSLVDIRPVRDATDLEGKQLEFKLIKLDQKRNNVVVSRRAVLEEATSAEREALLATLQEGMQMKGVVKNLTDYGAFVDLGGIDGLLHITDMAWRRIKHPSEIVNVGDEISVKVLKFDRERNRVSLGLKQLGEDPWSSITARYPVGTRVMAKVTNLTDYGCFAEIEEGVEGLVHVSEMDWTNKNIHPSKVVQVGDEVQVQILDVDEERRRISLGIKQCMQNPWEAFSGSHAKGDKVIGRIKSITDFGVFVGLDGNIDGLVHLSDLSWDDEGEEAVRNYKKGDEIEAVILSIDPDRERISLGIKQLEGDAFSDYLTEHDRGSVVQGTVTSVEERQAVLELAPGVEGILKVADASIDKITDVRQVLKEGDQTEVKIVGVDRKNRTLGVSIRAKDMDDEKQAVRDHQQQEAELTSPTTIGDLIKAQLEEQN
ncbi:MAG: 30S ribosomal protein S1 [Pseudomonadota bacterium]|nr:30S ribosomal protein S1 [Pseudomonadota bacterium]